MTRTLKADPLTAAAFAPFGDVIEASDTAVQLAINYGNTTRYHDLAKLDLSAAGGRAGISIFRSTPLAVPVKIKVMEFHPLSSQAFVPLSGRPYLVVVAPPGPFYADAMHAFVATGGQGVNYHPGTWHHFSLALEEVSDFLVIDRIVGSGIEDADCVEHALSEAEQVTVDLAE